LYIREYYMKQSQLFTKTLKNISQDEQSANAQLLERGGFVYKNSAGIYTYLPIGWRVMQKIAKIIKEEMDAIGGQEMYMPALHDKHYLKATGRWDVDVVFKVLAGNEKEPSYNISWTHEEIIAEIATKYLNSYKDLPFSIYQIQTKFRNEARAKSGILRTREFTMKDLYSFHENEEDLYKFYEIVKAAYFKIFSRCGLEAYCTLAIGGDFTLNNTHEFQVLSPVGEDTIYLCKECGYAENKEVTKLKKGDACPKCKGEITEEKSIEVGNIFPLGTKYSEAFDLKFTDSKGQRKPVVMGSYGIGLGRVMGTVVEIFHDEKGIMWPQAIAPFQVHLLTVGNGLDHSLQKHADETYDALRNAGVEVLYDDRVASPGEKFADADLIGIPYRAVVSEKTIEKGKDVVEVKKRSEKDAKNMKCGELINLVNAKF